MCFEKRDAKIAALCRERDLLKSELAKVTAERDALLAKLEEKTG